MVNLSLTRPMQVWCQIAMAPETWAGSRKKKPTVSRPPAFSFFKKLSSNPTAAQKPVPSHSCQISPASVLVSQPENVCQHDSNSLNRAAGLVPLRFRSVSSGPGTGYICHSGSAPNRLAHEAPGACSPAIGQCMAQPRWPSQTPRLQDPAPAPKPFEVHASCLRIAA
jgi:hypothetical protein